MKTNLFYSQSLNERIAFVKRKGEFISRIKFYGYYIDLYVVESELVEVYYNAQKHLIEQVEMIDPKNERLNLYVVRVSLYNLYH